MRLAYALPLLVMVTTTCDDGSAPSQPANPCEAAACLQSCQASGYATGQCAGAACLCTGLLDRDVAPDSASDTDVDEDVAEDLAGDAPDAPDGPGDLAADADLEEDPAIDAADPDGLQHDTTDDGGGGPGPRILLSTDFGPPAPVISFDAGTQITEIKLHADASGALTLYVDRNGAPETLLTRPAGGTWSGPTELTTQTELNLFAAAFARSDTAGGVFAAPQMVYLTRAGSGGPPYGPDTVHFNDLPDETEVLVTTTQAFTTGTASSFYGLNGSNLFQEADGTLHLAEVENYELFYHVSSDDGRTWDSVQIVTGHEGDIRNAVIVADRDGDLFIGFSANDLIGYANPTGVGYGTEGYVDLYCARSTESGWAVELVDAHAAPGNYGPFVLSAALDADNNVALYAAHYWWQNHGGEAWAYVRSGSTGLWSGREPIVSFTDAPVDRALYLYLRPLVGGDGIITVVSLRYRSLTAGADDELFYVRREQDSWSAPVALDTPNRAYATSLQFDAAIDGDDHVYVVYVKDPE